MRSSTRGRSVPPAGTRVDAVLDQGAQRAAGRDGHYGVLLLHRFEFLGNANLVRQTLAMVVEDAPAHVVMVVDDLARHSLQAALELIPRDRVTIVDKMPHA